MKSDNRRYLMLLAWLVLTARLVLAADFPLQVGASNRYLVDHAGIPFLIQGDSPWSLIIALNNAEVTQYLDDRKARGFNTILVNLIEHKFNGSGNPNPAPINRAGQAPFLTPGNFSTPNEAYFANADWVIDQAAARGMAVILFPCYVGYPGSGEGWYNEMLSNGTTKCFQYGQYLGNRYKNKPNIVWAMYGDHNPPAGADGAAIQPMVDALISGIQSTDTNHIFTAHLQRRTDVRTALAGDASWLQLNTAYTDPLTYTGALTAYSQTPVMPFFLIESYYEGETYSGQAGPISPATVRAQAYWANLSGAAGQMFGNNPLWAFDSGWQANLNSVGANDMTRANALFTSRSWTNLVPDSTHVVLTAGYGNYGDATYVSAARTTDGSTLIAYLPAGGTITVNLSKISGLRARAWWYDPRKGNPTIIGDFPTNDSMSFLAPTREDWVLVIDDTSKKYFAPGSK